MQRKYFIPWILIFLIIISIKTYGQRQYLSDTSSFINLGGKWQFSLDTGKVGIAEKWYNNSLSDSIILPGSLDENHKGYLNKDTTDMHLNRLYYYVGPAWFQKEIVIPKQWGDKNIRLILERTKVTRVWIDSVYIGSSNLIFTPQKFNLTGKISPGKHIITIMVDNTESLVPVAGSHAYSEDTQTNWNGILGKLGVEEFNKVHIDAVRIYPVISRKEVKVKYKISGDEEGQKLITLNLQARLWNSKFKQTLPLKIYDVSAKPGENVGEIVYKMGDDVQLWSEFNPAMYTLSITLKDGDEILGKRKVDFGMREFKTKGTQFTINGLTTFLRGKHDGAVFPLTGYPPMNRAGWLRVFRIAKSYGINHYRFHTWCPPEAAFEAADIEGIYLQPELPIWWGFNPNDSSQIPFMLKQGKSILDNYGNHPSFVMFALGNEIGIDRKVLRKMVDSLRAYDGRPLYAQGSNNKLWDPSYAKGDDYWTTFRTGKERADMSTDVRLSVSFLDSKMSDGGILNSLYPSTSYTYSKAIKLSPVPVIGHEVGQYQIYPDYNEMEKYTGVLKPWNFAIFKKRLEEKGMIDEAGKFFKASGALAVICYRAEIETALRTPGFGGFQLLDLQDYPGQGTALVGILDAFMDSKGLITPGKFREFCNDVVVLLETDKYCWKNNEKFKAVIKVANYGPVPLKNKTIKWSFNSDNQEIKKGNFVDMYIPQGRVTTIGKIEMSLSGLKNAQKDEIKLSIDNNTAFKNEYPVWIYPANLQIKIPSNIKVVSKLDADVKKILDHGGSVLIFPDSAAIYKNSVGGQFIPDFWNFGMFSSLAKKYGGRPSDGTLGILTDPGNKIFSDFPTEFHSDWQWWSIVKHSRPVILDNTNKNYRPIVQVIDNIDRNYKLGLIFEFKVGKGKLLVCSSDLPSINKPEAKQLYYSILKYMDSKYFNPKEKINYSDLKKILY